MTANHMDQIQSLTKQRIDFTAIAAHLCDCIIFVWDLQEDQIEIVAGKHESFGISGPSTLKDPTWWVKKIHPEDLPNLKELLSSIQPGQEKISYSYRVRRDDGIWIDVLDRAKVIWKYDKIHKLIGVTTNVSLLASTQRDLAAARHHAETASSIKSRFLANMSHELRTPLNAITSSIDLIRSTKLSHFESKKFLGVIQRNARHVLRLVDDILDLAKVEAEMLRIEPKTIQLRRFLVDIEEVFQLNANAKDLAFTMEVSPEVPETLNTDPGRVRQILNNLIGNALKFTESGFVRICIKTAGTNLEFRVIDSGPGIDGTEAQKLFTPFVQLDESLSRRYGGTGLGLSLSLKLSSLLGGCLSLESSIPDFGSTFLLTLPANPGKAEPINPRAAGDSPAATNKKNRLWGKRILLVDDADDNRVLFQKILELRGAKVTLASNGKECLEIMSRRSNPLEIPEVILMDIEMPVMDGPTALLELRKSGDLVPVIALTAHAMPEHRLEYLRIGFDGYISKPVDQQELIDLICDTTSLRKDPQSGATPH